MHQKRFFWNTAFFKVILALIGLGGGIWLGISHRSFPLQEIPTGPVWLDAHTTVVSPQGVDIAVMVANTDTARVSGLSGFRTLGDHQGMLFVFPQAGTYSFWMKDMNFPLDIIWIDTENKIVDRVINALPESYPKTFTSQVPALRVLEINANTADRDGFFVGSTITIKNTK